MKSYTSLLAVLFLLLLGSTSQARPIESIIPLASRLTVPAAATLPAVFAAAPAAAIDPAIVAPTDALERAVTAPRGRGFALLASTYVALNALDIYTTSRALNVERASEGNPVLAPVASTPIALTAVKIATTATTLVIAKRLWKEHRTASIVLMVAANVGTGFIVARNAAIAARPF